MSFQRPKSASLQELENSTQELKQLSQSLRHSHSSQVRQALAQRFRQVFNDLVHTQSLQNTREAV